MSDIKLPIAEDGSLKSFDRFDKARETTLDAYIFWTLGEQTIRMDGGFTAEELRTIADYMDQRRK